MLYRRIETSLSDWIHNSDKALLVEGARQVGKTFSIRKVLEAEGCSYVEFNLLETPELIPMLENSSTVDDMVAALSAFATEPLVRNKTFIFMDEIQEYKEVVTKIKFWVDEGSFRYILSGSLLGVELQNIKSVPVGYMTSLTMYPMDFEEFLQIYNFTPELKTLLERSFYERTPVNDGVHKRLMDIYAKYLIVGGMPAAVKAFKETQDLERVVDEHQSIIDFYKRDFTRYEKEEKRIYLKQIYDLIPAELNTVNKRFNYADIHKGMRYENGANDFIWLKQAGVALPTFNVEEPLAPLMLSEKRNLFKLFLSDVGMLTTMYGRATKIQLLSVYNDANNGAIYENAVAQELNAHGFKLYYYNNKKLGELDFVVEYNGKILPIEVKSGKEYKRHSALNNLMSAQNYSIDEAYVFTNYNVSVSGKVVYYPIYMLMFLHNDDIVLPKVELEDLMQSIFGCIPADVTFEEAREERLCRT